MYIETENLLHGGYELVPANTTTPESVSLNYTDLNQDPNQCSEEPKATFEQCPRRHLLFGRTPVHNPIIFTPYIHLTIFVYVVIIFLCSYIF